MRRELSDLFMRASTSKPGLRVVNKGKVDDKTVTEVYLYDEIGFWGVNAQDMQRELAVVDTDVIELHIALRCM